MFKRRLLTPTLIFFLILLPVGCANSAGASAGKIVSPAVSTCPLEGKWTVLQELGTKGNGQGTQQQWVGDTAQFTTGLTVIDGHVWKEPSYKIKRVKAQDYLMTKYIPLSGISLPEEQEVEVITVYAPANFLGEFMKLDQGRMISFVQNKALLLEKVADQVDSSLETANSQAPDLNKDGEAGISGVLLGLKTPDNGSFSYRTLWVAADDTKLRPVLTAKQIFFPRSSGFWKLTVQDVSGGGQTDNRLEARDIATKIPAGLPKERPDAKAGKNMDMSMDLNTDINTEAETESGTKIIDYIGNDYVAVETETAGINRLQVLPVDKIAAPAGIKISDLLGDKGLSVYLSAREQALTALNRQGITSAAADPSGENFGLVRKNGHWYLMGRINYQKGGTPGQADFNLNIIPPANLIFYDTLGLSWQNIKDRAPDAVDAFTSPNKEIALIKTKNKLYIYAVLGEQLAGRPLAELALEEGESIIMAEWATGSYVDSWEKAFQAEGDQAVPKGVIRLY